jgi:hypothetical protein
MQLKSQPPKGDRDSRGGLGGPSHGLLTVELACWQQGGDFSRKAAEFAKGESPAMSVHETWPGSHVKPEKPICFWCTSTARDMPGGGAKRRWTAVFREAVGTWDDGCQTASEPFD